MNAPPEQVDASVFRTLPPNERLWVDFCVGTAMIHAAMMWLFLTLPPVRYAEVMSILVRELQSSKGDLGMPAYQNVHGFVENAKTATLATVSPDEKHFLVGDAHGMWVVWEALNRAPSLNETGSVRILGTRIMMVFSDWWS